MSVSAVKKGPLRMPVDAEESHAACPRPVPAESDRCYPLAADGTTV